MKKEIYRKAALERLATTDQLDKVMKITSPLSWIALLGVTVIVVVVIIWSVVCLLPVETVTAEGIIVSSSTATNTITANENGTVVFFVNEGQYVSKGDLIAKITPRDANGVSVDCLAEQDYWISNKLVQDGTSVELGTELMRVRPFPRVNQKQVVVCYVPVADIGKIKLNKTATITLKAADNDNKYGHMEGQVINIDSYATTNKGIEVVVGSDNSMFNQFAKDGGVCAVTLQLRPANEAAYPNRKNDYYWTNKNGYNLEVNNKMTCTVTITTNEEKPIFVLFTKLKDILGGKNAEV